MFFVLLVNYMLPTGIGVVVFVFFLRFVVVGGMMQNFLRKHIRPGNAHTKVD